MYLQRIEIQGFKTFADRVRLELSPGITCVIGPNGAGKSNLADAILWVLGENNVRSLRGSTAQDVIFAGSARRRPAGMAEVALTLDNSAGVLPLEFAEVTVSRRLYRSGESECFINRVPCRLKDLYQLFLDTGVGRDAYALIGQGEVDQILSVRSEDRRALFEEAAGIKKYRVRKREAERKLELTAQNLLRVQDILAELEAQLGPLRRQAGAAQRYRQLGERLLALEHAWYGHRLQRLEAEMASLAALGEAIAAERHELDGQLSAARSREETALAAALAREHEAASLREVEAAARSRASAARTEAARASTRSEEIRRRLRALEQELAGYSRRLEEQAARRAESVSLERDLRQQVRALRERSAAAQQRAAAATSAAETAAASLEERRRAALHAARRLADRQARRKSLEARLESGAAALARAGNALREAEQEVLAGKAEGKSVAGALEIARSAVGALERQLPPLHAAVAAAREHVGGLRSSLDAAQRNLAAMEARFQALQELDAAAECQGEAARRVIDAAHRGRLPGVWRPLAASLVLPPGLECAVAAALGASGEALLCADRDAALAALALVGEAPLVLLPGPPPPGDDPAPWSLAALLPPPASGEEGGAQSWARRLLARTVITPELPAVPGSPGASGEEAPQLWVTPRGEWVTASGAMGRGYPSPAEGAARVLARSRELAQLAEELPERRAAMDRARGALLAGEAALEEAAATLREREGQLRQLRQEAHSHQRELERRRADIRTAEGRVSRAASERDRLEREVAQDRAALESMVAEGPPEESDPVSAGDESGLASAHAEAGRLELARREAEREWTELRVALAEYEERLNAATAAVRRAQDAGAFLDRSRAERVREQRALQAELEQGRLQFEGYEEEAAEADRAATGAAAAQVRAVEARAAAQAIAEQARRETHLLHGRLRELLERAHQVESERNSLSAQCKAVAQAWLESAERARELTPPRLEGEPCSDARAGEERADHPSLEVLREHHDAVAAATLLSGVAEPEAELARLRRQLRALGPVNLEAEQQYAVAAERFEFLSSQRADLEAARARLEETIAEIDAASRDTFLRAFREIATAFDTMFRRLFGGGKTELRLTDPADLLETGVDVLVQPPGKKQQSLLLLSGGERALTASALLFALLTVRPSPFCVLDEVDAALDEPNVARLTRVLRELSAQTQFILITHNRSTMEHADTLFGVTSEEQGVSRVLRCTLEDPLVAQVETESAAAAGLQEAHVGRR